MSASLIGRPIREADISRVKAMFVLPPQVDMDIKALSQLAFGFAWPTPSMINQAFIETETSRVR